MGGEPLPPLKSKTTHAEFYSNGKLTASYLDSLYGTMFVPLMANHGEERSMLSVEDSPAKISVAPEKAKGWKAKGRGSGIKWRGSSAKCNRDMSSWKIAPCSQEEDLTECSWTWPKWGTMQDGECLELAMSEPHTKETECGLWRSPAAREPGISIDRLVTKTGDPVGSMCRHYDRNTGRS